MSKKKQVLSDEDLDRITKRLGGTRIPLNGSDPLGFYLQRQAEVREKYRIAEAEKAAMKKAVCILIFNEEGKVLGVSRKDNPEDFGLPGGKLEPGETEEAAVVRELREETGLEITEITKIFQHSAEREYWTSCWTGKINGTIHTTEKGVVKWLEPEVLMQGCFGEYNKLLFNSLPTKNGKEFEH